MRPLRRVLACAITAAALTAACGNTAPGPGPELLDEIDIEPETSIEITETGFSATTLAVEVGEAFEVTNTGTEPHAFRIRARDVDTGLLLPGESTVIVLTTEGTVEATDSENGQAALTIEVTTPGG